VIKTASNNGIGGIGGMKNMKIGNRAYDSMYWVAIEGVDGM
jgi:hypothetical protein